MSFHSIYRQGFARIGACVTVSTVADPTANAAAILEAARACHNQAVAVAVFPELCLSGYAIEDLVMQDSLLDSVQRGLAAIVRASAQRTAFFCTVQQPRQILFSLLRVRASSARNGSLYVVRSPSTVAGFSIFGRGYAAS